MSDQQKVITNELTKLLNGGSAHAHLETALDGLPEDLRGAKPGGLPYSIWQLVEHIRIAQWDMLEFSRDSNHKSPKWPDDYWVKETAPQSNDAWKRALEQIKSDRKEFIVLLNSSDIYQPLAHDDGQSVLREALQIADHNAYHIAEIIMIRRLLGAWKPV